MSIADEIAKLQALHAQGALTDDEFSQARARLHARLLDEWFASDPAYLRLENEIQQLDLDWERERESYMVRSRSGSLYVPSEVLSVLGVTAAVGFGIFLMVSAASMSTNASSALAGAILIILGPVVGIFYYTKATEYKQAERNYQERRQQLISRSASAQQSRSP